MEKLQHLYQDRNVAGSSFSFAQHKPNSNVEIHHNMHFPDISAALQVATVELSEDRVARIPVVQIAKETSLAVDTLLNPHFQTFGITK